MPITKKTSAGQIIGDFEKSDNPKFAGKSKEERRKMALGAYYSKHPEKSNKNESVEVKSDEQLTELEKGGYDAHQALVTASEKPKVTPIPSHPKPSATHIIVHPNGMKQSHTGTDATAQAAASKVGGTVKTVPQITKESIEQFISLTQSGDKAGAQDKFLEALMDKLAFRMEDLKVDVAQAMFGFGEARKFDDDDGKPEKDKKKGEDVRKARRAKAQAKFQSPEIETQP